jgi:hypothetical protein
VKEPASSGGFLESFLAATSAVSFATSFGDTGDANESCPANNKIIRCCSVWKILYVMAIKFNY